MKDHDFKTLNDPVVRTWDDIKCVGGNPIRIPKSTKFDRACSRCGVLLRVGDDPAYREEDWKDCDLMITLQVMSR